MRIERIVYFEIGARKIDEYKTPVFLDGPDPKQKRPEIIKGRARKKHHWPRGK